MGKRNLAVNRLLERKEIFADLINGTVFSGKQILHPDRMELLSAQSGVFQQKENGVLRAVERRGDIRMKADIGMYTIILANETQGKVDYGMPVRNMLYDALEYTKQMEDLEKHHREAGDNMKKDAFLSGITKEDRLVPVLTTVLYLGDQWDGAEKLHELFDVDEKDELWQELKRYIPDYHINVIHGGNMEDVSGFVTSLQIIFQMLQYRKDKEKLREYLDSNREKIETMDSVERMAAFVMLGEQKRIENWLSGRNESEEWSMCQAIEDMIRDGERKGEKRGEKRGEIRGENRMASLMKCLLKDNRTDLIAVAAEDAAMRQKMYREYGI